MLYKIYYSADNRIDVEGVGIRLPLHKLIYLVTTDRRKYILRRLVRMILNASFDGNKHMFKPVFKSDTNGQQAITHIYKKIRVIIDKREDIIEHVKISYLLLKNKLLIEFFEENNGNEELIYTLGNEETNSMLRNMEKKRIKTLALEIVYEENLKKI